MIDVGDILFDSFKDSLLIFAFVFLIHIALSYFEEKISHFFTRHHKSGPLFGSLFGLVPQCGTSVIGADLYIYKYITLGTLCAIFLSCSDEAFIAILTSGSEKTICILPLIAIKFLVGFVAGFIIDFLYKKQSIKRPETNVICDTCHVHDEENTPTHQHLIHPLMHSLEIFVYVFVINLLLGIIIALVGKENFSSFLEANKYLTPLYSCLIGLIPNCASSLLISELFISGNLSFGALVGGLLVNSGLGMLVLLKNRHQIKNAIFIILLCLFIALIVSYCVCLINGF